MSSIVLYVLTHKSAPTMLRWDSGAARCGVEGMGYTWHGTSQMCNRDCRLLLAYSAYIQLQEGYSYTTNTYSMCPTITICVSPTTYEIIYTRYVEICVLLKLYMFLLLYVSWCLTARCAIEIDSRLLLAYSAYIHFCIHIHIYINIYVCICIQKFMYAEYIHCVCVCVTNKDIAYVC
jgi:hypothetical protein